MDSALNKLLWLICHKTKSNQKQESRKKIWTNHQNFTKENISILLKIFRRSTQVSIKKKSNEYPYTVHV